MGNIEFLSFILGVAVTLFCLLVFRDVILRRLVSCLFIKSTNGDVPVNNVIDQNKINKAYNELLANHNGLVDDFNELRDNQADFVQLVGLLYTICNDYSNSDKLKSDKLIDFMKDKNISDDYFKGCQDLAIFLKSIITNKLDIEADDKTMTIKK